jgi:type II secretory pathway pseudopilin PulG
MQPTKNNGALAVSLVVVILFLIGAVIFGLWAFNSRQDYKNNTDKKINVAVAAAKAQTQAADAKTFAQESENPLKTYTGPEAFGTLIVKYPKTWSAYVSEDDSGSTPIDAYFQPDYVPNITGTSISIALRVQVLQQAYSDVVSQYTNNSQQGSVTITPYSLPKVPGVTGVRIDGQIFPNVQGSLIVLPLRNETLQIWTESQQYEADFNNTILPNFSFSP